jgi:hypothetical protein
MTLSFEVHGNDVGVNSFKREVSAESGTSAFGGSKADPDVEAQTILTQGDLFDR